MKIKVFNNAEKACTVTMIRFKTTLENWLEKKSYYSVQEFLNCNSIHIFYHTIAFICIIYCLLI